MPPIDSILEITFSPEDDQLEQTLEGMLYLYDSSGIVIEDRGEQRTVRAFFPSAERRSQAAAALSGLAVQIEEIDSERQDWLALYQQSLEPIVVGMRFIVAPDADLLPLDSDRIPLIVPQERAFGTGSHETTALCLEMLEKIELSGKRGVDIGCGSAILAIAMIKLGARSVVAFDNDLETVDAIRANLERNGVTNEQIFPFIGSAEALSRNRFDIVTMNIIPEVIIPLLPHVVAAMVEEGVVIFSGILLTARDAFVASAVASDLKMIDEKSAGEWWCGVFSRA